MKTVYQRSIEEILGNLQPEDIPEEFISAANVMTRDGESKLFTKEEYKSYIDHHSDEVMQVRVLLDVEKTVRFIEYTTSKIFKI